MTKFFRVLHKSKKSKARVGEIHTGHGVIKTPAFVPVATKGTIKALLPSLVKEIGIQAAFVNTYHLVVHPGVSVIEKAGGIHKFANLNIPLMSDFGGFQTFSLASKNTKKANIRGGEEPMVVKISEDGVLFRSTYDGKLTEFTPEKSIKYQMALGTDMMMAFDECIPYGPSYEYSKKATERTHNWLLRSVGQYQKLNIKNQKDKSKIKNKQYLYGIIQGGVF